MGVLVVEVPVHVGVRGDETEGTRGVLGARVVGVGELRSGVVDGDLSPEADGVIHVEQRAHRVERRVGDDVPGVRSPDERRAREAVATHEIDRRLPVQGMPQRDAR